MRDCLPIWQGKLLITEHGLSPQLPSEAPRCLTSLPARNVLYEYTSFSLSVSKPLLYVGSLTLSCMQSFYTYVCNYIWLFSLVNLSHVCLIIRLTRKNLMIKFPSHTQDPESSRETFTSPQKNLHKVPCPVGHDKHLIPEYLFLSSCE